MENVRKLISYVLVAMLSSVVTMSVFCSVPKDDYSKLEGIADLIETYFIEDADRTAMEDAAAAAMVASLGDEWSYYLTAEESKKYTEQLENAYVGLGVSIRVAQDGTGFSVVEVYPESSAEEAGILAGDVIIMIEGNSAAGMTSAQARKLIRGEEGTPVTLTVRRNGETIEMSATRKIVQTAVTNSQMLESGIGLVRIYNFDDRCAQETIAAIEDLLQQGAEALILDVRSNPGGYKEELVALLDYLLPEGPLFRSEDYSGEIAVEESDAKYLDIPMAVMVDAYCYSAAEFFAAALDEYDAAVVVGTPTVGKGYFQKIFQLSDGSIVGLSIGKYMTPNGVSLANVGITPEICVEVDEKTTYMIYRDILDPKEDPQIQAAVEALKTK